MENESMKGWIQKTVFKQSLEKGIIPTPLLWIDEDQTQNNETSTL